MESKKLMKRTSAKEIQTDCVQTFQNKNLNIKNNIFSNFFPPNPWCILTEIQQIFKGNERETQPGRKVFVDITEHC